MAPPYQFRSYPQKLGISPSAQASPLVKRQFCELQAVIDTDFVPKISTATSRIPLHQLVWSSTRAPGALDFTDAIPFSRADALL